MFNKVLVNILAKYQLPDVSGTRNRRGGIYAPPGVFRIFKHPDGIGLKFENPGLSAFRTSYTV